MNKRALYYITEEDGRSRQVVNNVVTSLSQKKPIRYAPIGSHDIMLKWVRNMVRHGQVRSFSLPLGFVREAAMILRDAMYMGTIDRKLFLLIQRFFSTIDNDYFYDRYHFLYKGELDFSTFEDLPAESRVNINTMEGGLSKLVKANENTQFEIPFDEDAINIEMDGIRITGVYQYTLPEDSNVGGQWVRGMIKTGEEQKAPGIATFDLYGGVLFNPAQVLGAFGASNTEYFMQVNIPPDAGAMNISGIIRMAEPNPIFPANITLKIFNIISGTQRFYADIFTGPEAAEIPIDYDVTLQEGDRLFLTIDEKILESNLTFTLKTRQPASTIKAFRPLDLFKKICAKLGIPVDKVTSTLLEACNIMITSGDGIRGIANAGVKTSFNDFCKAFDVYLMTGVRIKDTVEMESRLAYYVPDNPISLGSVSGFKTNPTDDLMFSSIKVGHKDQDIEDVNGKYDPNGYHIYTTPVLKGGGKEMDLVSPYKAGPYEIESIRANLDGKESTDDSRDNQPFAIACSGGNNSFETLVSFQYQYLIVIPNGPTISDGQKIVITGSALGNDREYIVQNVTTFGTEQTLIVDVEVVNEPNVAVTINVIGGVAYTLDRSITVTAGVPDPASIFNIPLTPKRLLMAHYRWIRSWLYNYEGQLTFQQGNRNTSLVAGGITESAHVPISSMGEIMFKPWYFDFKASTPTDIPEILDTTPENAFLPIWRNDSFPGFPIDVGIAPNSLTPQNFKLLATPDFNELNLIV